MADGLCWCFESPQVPHAVFVCSCPSLVGHPIHALPFFTYTPTSHFKLQHTRAAQVCDCVYVCMHTHV